MLILDNVVTHIQQYVCVHLNYTFGHLYYMNLSDIHSNAIAIKTEMMIKIKPMKYSH